jgi:hypothetical protein
MMPMQPHTKEWKSAVERLWTAPVFDYAQAAQLAAEMARQDDAPALQHAAAQALPSLRRACQKAADRHTREVAKRRLGAVRNLLHALDAPRFGKRGSAKEALTPEDHCRRLLGLPLGRRLFGPEIHQAYKRAAKTVHPDAGGSEQDFLALSAARDALMKEL